MVFSSITFLFFFLPLVLAIYTVAGRKLQNAVLLLASLFFYTWGEGIYLLVMLVSMLVNYLCGCLMIRGGTPSSRVLITGILFNLTTLGFFKYANFLTENLNALLLYWHLTPVRLEPVHLPIGISFFTFQAMSYIIDVYQKKVEPQRNPLNLSLYIALFPQLIAGPIVRYHDIAKELVSRKMTVHGFASGGQRFLMGLGKKVLIANPLAEVADQVFALPATELTMPLAWLGALCYTFQIYFDFSGYSDMAIGLGRMFGFHFPENFNYPYISRSIREFWRRWHISLSTWLRDYVYIPLGGSRKEKTRTQLNLITVFLLCGLWHGASWTFVLWGAYHGLFLSLERTRLEVYRQKMWVPVQHIVTLLIIVVGWVLFRAESLADAIRFLAVMFIPGNSLESYHAAIQPGVKLTFELAIAILISLPLYPLFCRLQDTISNWKTWPGTWCSAAGYFAQLSFFVTLTYFTVISLAAGAYNPFIYFRF